MKKKSFVNIKVAAMLLVMSACAFSAAAQLTVGAKGTFGIGLGTTLEGDASGSFTGWGRYPTVSGGGGIFFRADFIRVFGGMLGAQAEVSFSGPYGLSVRNGGTSMTYSVAAVDFPLSVTYTLPVAGIIRLVPAVGVNFSVPVGNVTGSVSYGGDSYTSEARISHFNFGMAFGVSAETRLGPGYIMAELRYMMDFTRTRVEQVVEMDKDSEPVYGMADFLTRRSAHLSVGYQIPLSL